MGHQVWCTCSADLRPRPSIHRGGLGDSLRQAGRAAPGDNRVPSTEQRNGRTSALANQRCLEVSGVRPKLVCPLALGAVGFKSGTERKLSYLLSRAGLWQPPRLTWTIPRQTDLIMEDDVAQPAVSDPPPTRPLAPVRATAKLPESIQRASHMYVRRGASGTPLTPLYSGPYKILRRGLKSVDIEFGGRTETVSVDRLKPHTAVRVARMETPPRRGRLPGKPSGSSRPVS
jgi:hypothetical protein